MRCQKQKNRSFLTLWEVLKCGCSRKEDIKIDSSNSFLMFLYLEFLCEVLFSEEEKAIYYYIAKAPREILTKLMKIQTEVLVCWVEKEEETDVAMPLFEDLLDNQIPIFILCEN